MKYKQVRVSEFVDNDLNDIVKYRRSTGNLVNTRAGVISELITKTKKREVKANENQASTNNNTKTS